MGKKIDIGPSNSKEIEAIIKKQKLLYKKCAKGLVMKKPGKNIKKSKVKFEGASLFNCMTTIAKNYNNVIKDVLKEPLPIMKSIETTSKKVVSNLTDKSFIRGWEALVLLQNTQLSEDESKNYYSKILYSLKILEDLKINPSPKPRDMYASKFKASLNALNTNLKTTILDPLNKKFIELMPSNKTALLNIINSNSFAILDPENIYTILVVKAKLDEDASEETTSSMANAYKELPEELKKFNNNLQTTLSSLQTDADNLSDNAKAVMAAILDLGIYWQGYMKEKSKKDKKDKKHKKNKKPTQET